MNQLNDLFLLLLTTYIIIKIKNYKKVYNIYINSNFMDKWFFIYNKKYICGRIKCYISNDNKYNYNAIIYSRVYNKINIKKEKKLIYIILNLEANSRWKDMKTIINGASKAFDILISYKLLFSKHHFSYPYYRDIDILINDSRNSLTSITEFMKRRDIIFIYKIPYKKRNRLCEMFDNKIKVDKFGLAFKNHLKWPINRTNEKYLLIRNYKFCLAIENTINQVKWGQMYSDPIDDDYVTEKLWDCMRGGSIPIYFGAKNINIFRPTNMSIINTNDFANYHDLIEYVYSIKNDKKILNQYISWPFNYSKSWYKKMKYYSITPCKLCTYIKSYKK